MHLCECVCMCVSVSGCDRCLQAVTTSSCFPQTGAVHRHTSTHSHTRGDLTGWLRHPGLISKLIGKAAPW